MNGQPKIEIFKPFGEAFEWMKRILFQPFDFKKWLVLGFAAFIAGNSGGGFSGNFNPAAFRDGKMPPPSTHFNWSDLGPWWTGVIIVGAVLLIVLILVLIWVVSRGRFVLTDCIVKNRAAIVDPWHEFRREGNSFFLFTIAVGICAILIFGALALIIVLPFGIWSDGHVRAGSGLALGIILGCVALVWFLCAIFFGLVSHLMVPVMYRQRIRAADAFVQVARLVMKHLGSFFLFVLFSIVLFLAFLVISTVATCATCCIGALPYVSSVLLLPAIVCISAFKLYFLRQFGNEYDVWNGMPPSLDAGPTVPPIPVPPVQA